MLALHSLCRDGHITEVKFTHLYAIAPLHRRTRGQHHISSLKISFLAVSKAAFQPHQQPGQHRAPQP